MPVGARSRVKRGPGRATWIIFAGAACATLAGTFVLGTLVGREWGRQTPRTVVAESGRSATSSRRSGLSDVGVERARPPQEKLTFYQTLTAPLGAPSVSGKAAPSPRSQPTVTPRPSGPSVADRAARPSERVTATVLPPRAAPDAQGADRPVPLGEPRREASSEWTVQVGVFTTPERAERVRKELAEAGFHPRVTSAVADGGQPRFRVRLGEFKTKEEALRTADRVRADRSLPTFVTAK